MCLSHSVLLDETVACGTVIPYTGSNGTRMIWKREVLLSLLSL